MPLPLPLPLLALSIIFAARRCGFVPADSLQMMLPDNVLKSCCADNDNDDDDDEVRDS